MSRIPIFLDTTIQVDRAVGEYDPKLSGPVQRLLAEYPFRLTCGFSRLEFKRVVIQNLGLLLRYLSESDPPSYFAAMQRATRAGTPRRGNTLVNILAWTGFRADAQVVVSIGDSLDRQLALKTQAILRNAIRTLWFWFDAKVDSVVDRMQCQRSREGPRPTRDDGFDLSIPESRCKTKDCNNANFFRSHYGQLRKLAQRLRTAENAGATLSDEILTAIKAIESAASNADRLYDYKRCLELGDVWIHLECLAAGVSDFGTRNYKESEILCPELGLTMRRPE